MTMRSGLRKFALTAHVTASVGWLGTVAAFLAVALAGLNSDDPATLASTDLRAVRVQLVVDAAAAVFVLLVAATLSVYKPRGLTPYGRRKLREQRAVSRTPQSA